MKVEIDVAVLAFIRSKGLDLTPKDYRNLLLAINEQISSGEVKQSVKEYIARTDKKASE